MSKVNFRRIENSSNIDSVPIEDGNFIVTGDGKSYVDYGENRIPTNGTPDASMSDSSRNTVENNVVKNYVDTNIATVNTNLGGRVLWSNPNPTNSFGKQNITLNSDDYDVLEFYFFCKTTGYPDCITMKTVKGRGVLVQNVSNISKDTDFTVGFLQRRAGYISDTEYSISNTLFKFGIDGTTVSDNYNDEMIPYKVIGYKIGLFE